MKRLTHAAYSTFVIVDSENILIPAVQMHLTQSRMVMRGGKKAQHDETIDITIGKDELLPFIVMLEIAREKLTKLNPVMQPIESDSPTDH